MSARISDEVVKRLRVLRERFYEGRQVKILGVEAIVLEVFCEREVHIMVAITYINNSGEFLTALLPEAAFTTRIDGVKCADTYVPSSSLPRWKRFIKRVLKI